MTEFRVGHGSNYISIELRVGKLWAPFASVNFNPAQDKKNTLFVEDITDHMKAPLDNPKEAKKREEFLAKNRIRDEFKERFGLSPIRFLWFLLARRFGSVRHGLAIIPKTEPTGDGKDFLQRLKSEGWIKRKGRAIFLDGRTVRLLKSKNSRLISKRARPEVISTRAEIKPRVRRTHAK